MVPSGRCVEWQHAIIEQFEQAIKRFG